MNVKNVVSETHGNVSVIEVPDLIKVLDRFKRRAEAMGCHSTTAFFNHHSDPSNTIHSMEMSLNGYIHAGKRDPRLKG